MIICKVVFSILLSAQETIKYVFMGIFLTAAIAFVFTSLAIGQILGNSEETYPDDKKKRLSPYILLSMAFHLVCSLHNGNIMTFRTPFAVLVGLTAYCSLCFLTLSDGIMKMIVLAVVVTGISFGLYDILHLFSGCPVLPELFYVSGTVSMPLIISMLYVYGIYSRLKSIKTVVRLSSTWTTVCLCVDSIYVNVLLGVSVMFYFFNMVYGVCGQWGIMIYTLSLALFQCALVTRVSKSSAFVLWTEHERKIIEAMQLSRTDSIGDTAGSEALYKGIYERVLEYFEAEKPYLKHDLTINDVVSVVFTNKLYISKAISQYAGRNFCQFVNYYRVLHAVELFREDTSLKIVDMATKSGFNSSVSFSMAFRLYMGEKPGDWCRKERSLLEKRKK